MSNYKSLVQRQLGEIAAARAATSTPLQPPKSAEELLGIRFTPGQRVMDSQSGSYGTVRAGTIVHRVVPATPTQDGSAPPAFFALPNRVDDVVITVELDGGDVVERAPKDLIALPASLALPLAHLEPAQ